jgi:hypothetical protein
MGLDEELINLGYQRHGPYLKGEVPDVVRFLSEELGIVDMRIVLGKEAPDDMKKHPGFWMVYSMPPSVPTEQYAKNKEPDGQG